MDGWTIKLCKKKNLTQQTKVSNTPLDKNRKGTKWVPCNCLQSPPIQEFHRLQMELYLAATFAYKPQQDTIINLCISTSDGSIYYSTN